MITRLALAGIVAAQALTQRGFRVVSQSDIAR